MLTSRSTHINWIHLYNGSIIFHSMHESYINDFPINKFTNCFGLSPTKDVILNRLEHRSLHTLLLLQHKYWKLKGPLFKYIEDYQLLPQRSCSPTEQEEQGCFWCSVMLNLHFLLITYKGTCGEHWDKQNKFSSEARTLSHCHHFPQGTETWEWLFSHGMHRRDISLSPPWYTFSHLLSPCSHLWTLAHSKGGNQLTYMTFQGFTGPLFRFSGINES